MALSPELKMLIASRAAPVADEQRYERILSDLKADLADLIAEVESWIDELSQLRPVAESVLASASKLRDDLYDLRAKFDADEVYDEELDVIRALNVRYDELNPLVKAERQRNVGPL